MARPAHLNKPQHGKQRRQKPSHATRHHRQPPPAPQRQRRQPGDGGSPRQDRARRQLVVVRVKHDQPARPDDLPHVNRDGDRRVEGPVRERIVGHDSPAGLLRENRHRQDADGPSRVDGQRPPAHPAGRQPFDQRDQRGENHHRRLGHVPQGETEQAHPPAPRAQPRVRVVQQPAPLRLPLAAALPPPDVAQVRDQPPQTEEHAQHILAARDPRHALHPQRMQRPA